MDEKQWSFASVALFWILVGAVLGMVMGVPILIPEQEVSI